MTIEFVQGTLSQIDELERLYNDLNDYLASHINYPGWRKGIYPTREQAVMGVREQTLYTALSDGRIVGSLILNHEPEKAPERRGWLIDAKADEVFAVHTFAVHPAFFGNGLGRNMLAFADELAQKEGIKSIRLDVYEKNMPAIRTYEAAGYQYIDTVDIGLGQFGLNWFHLYEKPVQQMESKEEV